MTEILTLIPARGGSKGIPRKNIRSFAGYPLVAWSIAAAKQSDQVTRVIVSTANRLLETIYKSGYGYQKAGVQLSHIQSEALPGQIDLFDDNNTGLPTENRELMKAVDQINRRFPKSVSIASTGLDKTWKPKTERISQRYTTDWNELVKVKC